MNNKGIPAATGNTRSAACYGKAPAVFPVRCAKIAGHYEEAMKLGVLYGIRSRIFLRSAVTGRGVSKRSEAQIDSQQMNGPLLLFETL